MKAIVREVGDSLTRCELTYLQRNRIDVARAREQHQRYTAALRSQGFDVHVLPALEDLPDAPFVEDAAIVFAEVAVLTRPGAPSRRPEVELLRPIVAQHRPVLTMRGPGTLEGGDVLVLDRTVYVGESRRSDRDGIEELRRMLRPFDLRVRSVPIRSCLHLKTAVGNLGSHRLLVNLEWVDGSSFEGREILSVDSAEPFAANVLFHDAGLVRATGSPKTKQLLEARGITFQEVDISELQKAEAGVTCLALLVPDE